MIVTRCDGLREIFNELGKDSSYGNLTIHMGKLILRINGGGAAGNHVLIPRISRSLYIKGDID